MFFGKKAKIIPPEPPAQFKKEKLSPEALDHFVEKYLVIDNPNKEVSLPYIMQNGEQVYLSGLKTSKDNNCNNHFKYLLAQTLPYHQPHDLEHLSFHLKDLIFIVNEDGKAVPWAKKSKDAAQFTQIADFLGLLVLSRHRSK